MTDPTTPRTIDLEVEVPGTPEEVWEAIATGPGISAWMHPTEVEEREGGRLAYDMGSGMKHTGRVAAWDPPRRLVQADDWQPGQDGVPGARLATEWRVEARAGGTCVVRMVMSGFGSDAGWEEEVQGMAEGMRLALQNLRLYLTHFPGQRGAWIRVFGSGSGARAERWAALTAALGFADANEGDRVAASGDGVPALAGVVEHVVDERWHRGLILRIDEPAPGLAHLLVYGDDGWMTLQACLHGDGAAAVAAREEPEWRAWMSARFPSAAAPSRAG